MFWTGGCERLRAENRQCEVLQQTDALPLPQRAYHFGLHVSYFISNIYLLEMTHGLHIIRHHTIMRLIALEFNESTEKIVQFNYLASGSSPSAADVHQTLIL